MMLTIVSLAAQYRTMSAQQIADDLAAYSASKGALRFPVDTPLPMPLDEKLIAVRLRQIAQR